MRFGRNVGNWMSQEQQEPWGVVSFFRATNISSLDWREPATLFYTSVSRFTLIPRHPMQFQSFSIFFFLSGCNGSPFDGSRGERVERNGRWHAMSSCFNIFPFFYLRRRNFIIPFSSANRKGIVFIRLNCPLGSGDWNKQSGSKRFFLFLFFFYKNTNKQKERRWRANEASRCLFILLYGINSVECKFRCRFLFPCRPVCPVHTADDL